MLSTRETFRSCRETFKDSKRLSPYSRLWLARRLPLSLPTDALTAPRLLLPLRGRWRLRDPGGPRRPRPGSLRLTGLIPSLGTGAAPPLSATHLAHSPPLPPATLHRVAPRRVGVARRGAAASPQPSPRADRGPGPRPRRSRSCPQRAASHAPTDITAAPGEGS